VSGLRLLAAAPTPGLRQARFGGDDNLDEGGLRAALALSGRLGNRGDEWVCGPSRAARQTARAVFSGGGPVQVEPALADPGYGRWDGQALDEVAQASPDGLGAWLTDPQAAPHGGESLAAVRLRVGAWLEQQAGQDLVAVAHPVVVRAAVVHALGLPDAAVWQLDVAPLSVTRLTHRANRWHVHFPAAAPTQP
jgi:broad specificity phosphatase PhoE